MYEPDFLDITTEDLLMELLNFDEENVSEFNYYKTEFYELILNELFNRCPAEPLEDRPWYMSDFEFNIIVFYPL